MSREQKLKEQCEVLDEIVLTNRNAVSGEQAPELRPRAAFVCLNYIQYFSTQVAQTGFCSDRVDVITITYQCSQWNFFVGSYAHKAF